MPVRTVQQQAKALGAFNLAWSIPVPLSLAVTGPLLTLAPSSLFALAFVLNLVCVPILTFFPRAPEHISDTHPERFHENAMPGLLHLLSASRWSMVASYVLLFLLSPLLPETFADIGVPVFWATIFAAVMDIARVLAFALFRQWTVWHGRTWTIWVGWVGLPLGLVLCLLGGNVAFILAGEVLFGLASGLTYYAAIYYAMLIHNASVEAGGDHEGLIGAGFAIGPALGLVGIVAGGSVGPVASTLVFLALCTWRSAAALRSIRP